MVMSKCPVHNPPFHLLAYTWLAIMCLRTKASSTLGVGCPMAVIALLHSHLSCWYMFTLGVCFVVSQRMLGVYAVYWPQHWRVIQLLSSTNGSCSGMHPFRQLIGLKLRSSPICTARSPQPLGAKLWSATTLHWTQPLSLLTGLCAANHVLLQRLPFPFASLF